MPEKHLITGPAGCGSTALILERIKKRILEGKSEEIIVVVPNHEFLQTIQQKLIRNYGVPAIQGNMLQTVDGLARRFAPEIMSSLISPVYSRLLLKDVLQRPYLGLEEEGKKPGFRRRLGYLFHEIRAVHPERRNELLKILTNEFPDGPTGNRFVSKIVQAFEEFESELDKKNLCSAESAKFRAADVITSVNPSFYIYIIGFDDLEEPQLAILNPLIKNAKEVVIALPSGDEWRFRQSAELREKFLHMDFKEEKLSETVRFQDKSLLELERRFRTGIGHTTPDGISLCLTDGERDEADYIARCSASLIENGTPPEQILIIHPNPNKSSSRIENAFSQLGIKLRTNIQQSLWELSPARDLIAILALIGGEYEHSTSLSISRFAKQIRELMKHLDSKTIESLLAQDEVECPDDAIIDSWNLLKSLIKTSKNVKTIDDFKNFVISTQRKTIFLPQVVEEDPAKFISSAWNGIKELLDEMYFYYAASEAMIEKDFNYFLSDFINEAKAKLVKPKDRRCHAINLVGFEESRLREAEVVFLAGMNDLNFPPSPFNDPLLGDSTRKELVSRGFRFRNTEDDIDRNHYLLYSALTRARRKLTISCSRIDDRGESNEISPALIELFPTDSWNNISGHPRPLFTYDDLVTESALALRADIPINESDTIKKNLERYYPRGLKAIFQPNPLECNITEKFLKSKSYNASVLNDYITCPFVYFAQQILRIPQAETSLEKVFNPLIRGIAIHEYLALRLGHGNDEIRFRDVLAQVLEKYGYNFDDFDFGDENYVYDIELTLENFINFEKEKTNQGEYAISKVELPFGTSGSPSVKLPFEDGERNFSGRIDRIDKLPDGTFVVYDYKSASSTARLSEKFKEAILFQLPIYIIALKQLDHVISRAGIIVIARDGSRRKTNEDVKKELLSMETIEENGRALISQVIKSIENGNFHPQPLDTNSCGWNRCGYYHVCRINR